MLEDNTGWTTIICGIEPPPPIYRGSGYLDGILSNPTELLARASSLLTPHMDSFDTFVGRSVSGALALPLFAHFFRKNAVIVRKEVESHSTYKVEGVFGQNWIFLDDLIASGNTLRATIAAINAEYSWAKLYGAFQYDACIFAETNRISEWTHI